MMNPFLSMLAAFLGHFTVKGSRSRALCENAKRNIYCGVAVYCLDEERSMLESSLKEVAAFYGNGWSECSNLLKMVIVNNDVRTHLCIPQRVSIIQRSDRSRTSSTTHMASWLVADIETVRYFSNHSFLMVLWGKDVPEQASSHALSKRKKYLAGDSAES